MPHQAAISAIPPNPSKTLNMIISPNPEFWIPVSKEIARLSVSERLFKAAKPYPIVNAQKLWTSTIRNTNPR